MINRGGKASLFAVNLALLFIVSVFSAPLFAAFIDPAGKQVLAASAPGYASIAHSQHTIAWGNNKAYVIYMHDNRSDANNLDFNVAQYDFGTGQWTKKVVATTGKAGGNAIHNAGSIVRDPQGFLEVFYANNDAYYSGAGGYPYYKRTLVPDNLSTWSSQQPMTQNILIEPHAAFTPNGYLHVLLGHASGHAYYFRRDPQGNWASTTLLHNVTNNNDQAPGYGDWKIVGNTIHLTWCVYQPPFYGGCDGAYYIRSDDNGETWTNIDKTASFTRIQGLRHVSPCNPSPPYPATRTEAPCQFPAPYKVASGATSTSGLRVDALSDGSPVITNFNLSTSSILHVWKSGKWNPHSVSSNILGVPSIEVTTDNQIVIYAVDFSEGNLYEFISADGGATWKNALVATNNIQEVNAVRVSPPGQSDRMLVAFRSFGAVSGTYDLNFVSRTMTNSPSAAHKDVNPPASDFSLDIGTGSRGTIQFDINTNKNNLAAVSVYDLLGKRVFTRNLSAGRHTFRHNIEPGGIGFVVLKQGKQKIIKKVLLL